MKTYLFAACLLLGTAAFGRSEPAPSELPERISFLVAFGDEKCPEATGDEIVVCATLPENERYRIPVALRTKENLISEQSWSSALETLDSYARDLRPNSCSVNGSNGFTGCTSKLLEQWFAERRGKSKAN